MDFSNLQSRFSSSSAYFPPHRTQLHPRMHHHSSPPAPRVSPSRGDKCWILAAGLLTLPFLLYLLGGSRRTHPPSRFTAPGTRGFGVVIDAGPAGSRVHFFEFLNEGRFPFVEIDLKESASLKVRPGLREFSADPESAGKSISRLMDFARERVPRAEWRVTKVQLIDTGGLASVGLEARRGIMESCRQMLRSSGFLFRDEWASTITGPERGIYTWVAANYLLGTLGGNPQETMGIIELGGASAQVTFVPKEPPPMEFSKKIKLPGITYNLYSSSMRQFGQDAVWESLGKLHSSRTMRTSSSFIEEPAMSPCIPKGYNQTSNPIIPSNASERKIITINAVGNFTACRSEALMLLQGEDKCSHPLCRISPRFMPEVQGKPFAIERFFYTSELFGLIQRVSLVDVEVAGRHYCEEHWSKLKEEHYGIDEADLLKYCFSSAYIVALLHDLLGIPVDDKRIGFTDPVGSSPLGWTLGAVILQAISEPELETETMANVGRNDAIVYISLFAILFLAILSVLFVSRWRKPRLKTVYDLEKGRYLVTRIPR